MSLEKVATEKTAAVKPSETGSHAAFLIGTYFSGSTLLGNCLNAHPSIFFAGEIDRLEAFRRDPDWAHARERGCRLCSTEGEYDCPAWPRAFLDALTPLDDISRYRAVLDRTQAPILLDGSKRLDWLRSLHDAGLTSGVSVIICTRNPFAFANSVNFGATSGNPTRAAAT